jgi:gamma-glutamyltranspeptidase / glutathione hydrolase
MATTYRISRSSVLGIVVLVGCALAVSYTAAQQVPAKAVEAKQGMAVSVSGLASDVGVAVLQKGGNAVDAAVAVAFALAVTHPTAGNIGGGGFMLVLPPEGEVTFFDYRETAPGKATKDMFKKNESHLTHRVVGVPGTVRGLEMAHKRFGKLPWKDVVMPAVDMAEKGFKLERSLASSLNSVVGRSATSHPELARVYGKDGKPGWSAGDTIVLADLGKTLRLIAEQGPDAFYRGAIADLIAKEMEVGGGLITKDDLANYVAKERQPVHGTYRGFDVFAPSPPSGGGVCLVEMLNMLENYDLKKQGRWSKETLHVMTEAMRRAYCDRARWLGDPDFTKIPTHLTSKEYAAKLAKEIDLAKATPSATLATDIPLGGESESTTHFSVIDKDGLAVANTYTLEGGYGSHVVVKGAGFILNNEMNDFNWFPGVTNTKGTVGTDANLIVPGKRMLSSMTPTIVTKNGKVVLITGSPGGRTIINTVLCVVVNVIDFDMDVQSAVDAPRMHHQWFPDELHIEDRPAISAALPQLRAMGHVVKTARGQGDAHSIAVDPRTGVYQGAADKRTSSKAAGY